MAQFAKSGAWVYYQIFSPAIGAFTLTIGLLLSYYYLARRTFSLNIMILFILTAFLLFSKIVNEQYLFMLIPFLLLELSSRYSEKKELIYKLMWSLPLAFAIINVPIYNMLTLSLYLSLFKPDATTFQISMEAYATALPKIFHGVMLLFIACLFVLSCIYALRVFSK
ncbi:unnamed protein product, partial [marine sediment metagenome]